MNDSPLSLIDLTLEASDPVAAHLMRFARDVAWRHRRSPADARRFRLALEGYHRAWRIGNDDVPRELKTALVRALVAEYRTAHAALFRGDSRSRDAA
jgi:hypothetical protein